MKTKKLAQSEKRSHALFYVVLYRKAAWLYERRGSAMEEYGDELFIYAMALREQVDNDKAQAEQDGKQDED